MIRRRAGALVAALLLLAALAFGVRLRTPAPAGDERPRTPRAAPVIVEPVRFSTALTTVEAVGSARALRSVLLFPAAAGEVRQVLFRPGQQVKAGAPLLRLDTRRAELAVAQARVALQNARDLLRRYERTGDIGAVSATQVDQGRTAVEAARIALAQAEVDLADRTLRAPFGGHIGFSDIDTGDRVEPGTQIATLDDRSELLIDFSVPEAYVDVVRAGREIVAEPWTTGGQALQGVVETVGTRIDPQQRSFAVRARVANPGAAALPGLSFRIALNLPGRRLPALPEAAIVWGGEGSALWTVQDGKAVRVPAVIVQRRQGEVLVDAPLKEGELVVVEGVQRLREGMPVTWVDDRSVAARAASAVLAAPARSTPAAAPASAASR